MPQTPRPNEEVSQPAHLGSFARQPQHVTKLTQVLQNLVEKASAIWPTGAYCIYKEDCRDLRREGATGSQAAVVPPRGPDKQKQKETQLHFLHGDARRTATRHGRCFSGGTAALSALGALGFPLALNSQETWAWTQAEGAPPTAETGPRTRDDLLAVL